MRILLIEDDALYREELRELVAELPGVTALDEAPDVDAARAALENGPEPGLILLDMHLPAAAGADVELAGPALAAAARAAAPGARIVVISGVDPSEGLRLVREDLVDEFVSKDQPMREVGARLRQQLRVVRRHRATPPALERLVGPSAAMRGVREVILRTAGSPAPVLITGESGCGKELAAAAVHAVSPAAQGPFLPFHPAAVSEALLESELFGHAKGAFTGATQARPGVVEAAEGGTLFLDEIGELPEAFQVKLLRFLEDGSYYRVGEDRPRTARVRLVFATNRDLAREVAAGRFREDLRYRLDVLRVRIPPLRERPEDVVPIAEALLARLAAGRGRAPPRLARGAARALAAYPWPGNVRELRNILERALLFGIGAELTARAVEESLPRVPPPTRPAPAGADTGANPDHPASGGPPPYRPGQRLKEEMAKLEAAYLRDVLRYYERHVTRAAEAIGITRRTLQEKMRRYGIPGRNRRRSDR